MLQQFGDVFITRTGSFLPGPPIDNASITRFIADLNPKSARMRQRILRENGIVSRHYALDEKGSSRYRVSEMAANAVLAAGPQSADLLAAATTGADEVTPGFAAAVQAELGWGPLTAASFSGVCASGIAALDWAARSIDDRAAENAVVVASEFPSRLFKSSRFSSYSEPSFDAHFLRWMLSDGAGAWKLEREPQCQALRVNFISLRSFAGDYPTCMQVGHAEGNGGLGYLDYPDLATAEAAGAFHLRQDIRLLPNLFDVAVHEYARLVRAGWFQPQDIDFFLCHYSSERFRPVMEQLMQQAGLMIPPARWYSNLRWRGNIGAASILVMLDDFLRDRQLQPGQQLLLFVPESGRFTVGFVGLEVVDPVAKGMRSTGEPSKVQPAPIELPDAPFEADDGDPRVAAVLRELLAVWHEYRSNALRSKVARLIASGQFTREHYVAWMENWLAQVRQGAVWMRQACGNLPVELADVAELISMHANEEQFDFRLMFEDYRSAGGTLPSVDAFRRNPGGEALNAYMHARSQRSDAYALLGGIYIIEGTGQRIIPTLLPRIKAQIGVGLAAYRFLDYHGANDVAHLNRWLAALRRVLQQMPGADQAIVDCAREVAQLYVMQWRHVGSAV